MELCKESRACSASNNGVGAIEPLALECDPEPEPEPTELEPEPRELVVSVVRTDARIDMPVIGTPKPAARERAETGLAGRA